MADPAARLPERIEWPTVALIAGCYLVWALASTWLYTLSAPLAFVLLTLSITLHASLQHEVLHGHPFRRRWLNEAMVFLPVGLIFPFGRFRDLHLAHHRDEFLTDPYDDPESNYLDPEVWAAMPRWKQAICRANNTLLGRMLIGPALMIFRFLQDETGRIRAGDAAVRRAWALHLAGLVLMALWLSVAAIPVPAYLAAAYLAMSILKIRTFLEHRAHDKARARTVLIERGWLLPFLFLNNNLHVVHHARPTLAWYRLPRVYRAGREAYLRRNEAYSYRSYAEIFALYFLRAKDPVPHPLRRDR